MDEQIFLTAIALMIGIWMIGFACLNNPKGIIYLINKFKQFNITKMKTKYLLQALKFACLPTLSVVILLFFGFFSVDKTLTFLASNNGWAIFLRIFLVIAEIVMVVVMYNHYLDVGLKEDMRDGRSSLDFKRKVK